MKLKQVLIAFDQLINTIIGGYADETVSARAFRCRKKSQAWSNTKSVIDFVFFWQNDHCFTAMQSEKERSQLPVEYRE